jgi:glucuronokinase
MSRGRFEPVTLARREANTELGRPDRIISRNGAVVEAIVRRAYTRAGLMGNPSDGYGGKALAVSLTDFFAEVSLQPHDRVEVAGGPEDHPAHRSIRELADHVGRHGYYGGVRLLRAAAKAFADHCAARGIGLDDRGFRISYRSTVPRQVGLAGSSAIVVAALRALMSFYDVAIPRRQLASLALRVETEELGIPAGLMDRVAHVYGGLVALDLTDEAMEDVDGYPCGSYQALDPASLPPLYLAYGTGMAEPTEVVHGDLARRYRERDPQVLATMAALAALVDEARAALGSGRYDELGRLMDRNFELRASVSHVAAAHARMVELAREAGAPAKFAGSGGAIVGVLPDGALAGLRAALATVGCGVIMPTVAPSTSSGGS